MLASFVAHSFASPHSSAGSRSLIRESQMSSVRPGGRAVLLRPNLKSSMRMPIVTARMALEQEPMLKRVYAAISSVNFIYTCRACGAPCKNSHLQ